MQRFLSPLISVAKNYETVLHLIKDSTEEEEEEEEVGFSDVRHTLIFWHGLAIIHELGI